MPAKKTEAKSKAKETKKLIGKVSHFFDKISVAVIELKAELKQGDKILFEGPKTSFTQTVGSMQIEHEKIAVAKKGQSIGMKVDEPVRENDSVYKI